LQDFRRYLAWSKQETAFFRPPGVDVGNVNSTIVGTVNPAMLARAALLWYHPSTPPTSGVSVVGQVSSQRAANIDRRDGLRSVADDLS
jgi:hypothetical protein